MEGPGGYQFVGRTLQMWNRYREVAAFGGKPWLLRFFDQIRFYPVSADELLPSAGISPRALRPAHRTQQLNLADYQAFLAGSRKHRRVSQPSAGRFPPSANAGSPAARRISTAKSWSRKPPKTHRWPAVSRASTATSPATSGRSRWTPARGSRPVMCWWSGVDEDGNPAARADGGVVREIRVQPGSAVRAGQRVVVLELD
jgi:urea carboxylase